MKRTNLITRAHGKWFKVLKDEKTGNLYYRCNGHLHGTFIEDCIEA